jgi:methanogenic corrinoid protein MtbC1
VLRTSLERFAAAPAERLLRRLAAAYTPGVVVRDVVLPHLRELGERWSCGEATIAQEHHASCVLEGWMLGVARGWGRASNRRAVLACVPGEHHTLGLAAFGIALRDLGWSVTFLGRDTPLASVEEAAQAVGADVVVLAAALPQALERSAEGIVELARSRPVLVGGQATVRDVAAQLRARILPADVIVAARVLSLQGR